MKNILLITQGFPFGNSERGFLEIEYKYLIQNANVHILAITNTDVCSNEQAEVFHNYDNGVLEFIEQIRRKEVRKDIKPACINTGLGNKLKRIKRILSYSVQAEHIEKTIEKIVKENSIDIIYTYWCLPATVAASRLKHNYNFKVITRFHGFDLYNFREPCGWQPLIRYISQNVEKLIFACSAAENYFNDNIEEKKEKSVISYIGAKKTSVVTNGHKNPFRLISCSYVTPLKRVDLIATVVLQLSKKIKIEWYHIGGPIQKFDFLDSEKIKYVFYGNVEHERISTIFEQIEPDLFITLSTTEGGVPVSIQEAMSMGIPAIGTNVGGIPEIIQDAYNGFIIEKGANTEDIAKKILDFYMLSHEMKEQFSKNAYRTWEKNFDADRNAIKLICMLNDL